MKLQLNTAFSMSGAMSEMVLNQRPFAFCFVLICVSDRPEPVVNTSGDKTMQSLPLTPISWSKRKYFMKH